ncbi:ribosome-binding factor A [Metamycoplasma subdolum]|uniref:Ribosome-binding factor A n=1 Tax=Metamycoplasma subdolum TaxID=92407 RepID=A0A3L9ZYQ5_9BACT|nr:30S ribosome-binding factor RbfA [Metamycoplasma subdolum]RMA77576.1 ribosome-binding factor A [Metamycoplasma subdolum]WPB50370.1 30S ribosome-binding factor RbfA [Metamycoplasma subdolum]
MTNNINHERKTSLLLQLIGQSFYKLQDFDVTNIAINDVILSKDGSHAKVYVTFFKEKARYFEKITKMAPFIRSQVAHNWKYKKLPEMEFLIDNVEPSANRIEKILKKIQE